MLVIANTLFQQKRQSTHEHHQIVNAEIRLNIFFEDEDEGAVYSQQKQDLELTTTQIMSFLLKTSSLN